MELFPSSSQVAGRLFPEAVAVVAAGGAIGATGRWAVGTLFDAADGSWPWATIIVNLVGCLIVGWAALLLERGSLPWDFVVTGMLGGFTTMSAVAVEANAMVDADRPALAALYIVVTLAGGVAAVSVAGGAISSASPTPTEAA